MFHFWRVIGHCLGIEDRFNLCSGSDEEIFESCRQCYYNEWLPLIRSAPEPAGIAMAKGIAVTVPAIYYNSLIRFSAPIIGLSTVDYPLKTVQEKLSYAYLWLNVNVYARSSIMLWMLNLILRVLERISVWRRITHAKKLREKYNFRYEIDERCPFQTINYRTAFDMELH